MTHACECRLSHEQVRVVLTGGPGAGKTAALETARHRFCEHVEVLPESAGIVFSGGFPRHADGASRKAAQRAIYRVQRELERRVEEQRQASVVLCDRGTVDGMAYWPGAPHELLDDVGTTLDAELARYHAVVHMRTPGAHDYRGSALRIENAVDAHAIDEAIVRAWQAHPRRYYVDSTANFLEKIQRVLTLVREIVPVCCRPNHEPHARTVAET